MLTTLRQAAQRLAKTPGFAITALATLAICIGANLAIFAVVDGIVLRPLPFPSADRLVLVSNMYPGAGVEQVGVSIPNYFDRRHAISAFASVSAYLESDVIVGDVGSPNRVADARITPEFFATLGVPLAIGRQFTEAEMGYGPDQVAILTDGFWRTYFKADPSVIGRTFLNDGVPVVVVGVLPRGFHYLSSHAQFYRPLAHSNDDLLPLMRHATGPTMIARLAPGATVAEAQAQMNAFDAVQAADDPMASVARNTGYHTIVTPLHDNYVRSIRPTLLLLQCGVLCLLLVGGVNLANLLLIRTNKRLKELAVRLALGAGRRRLALDALAETTVLALAGSVAGLIVATLAIRLVPLLGIDRLPLGESVTIDGRVMAAALVGALLVGWLLAAPNIWFMLRLELGATLTAESRGGIASRGAQRVRHAFIVAQVALAFMLVSSAGLLAVSLKHVLDMPTGFRPSDVLTGRITLPVKGYKDTAAQLAFVERLLPAMRAIPGVTGVAINTSLPFLIERNSSIVAVEGITGRADVKLRAHELAAASADYWSTMGIRLLRGRLLTDADNHSQTHACVVDQAFADAYWPGGDPLGHRLEPGSADFDTNYAFTIVGVVANVPHADLAERSAGAVYFPFGFWPNRSFALAVRTTLIPAVMAPVVRKVILTLDPALPIDDVRPFQSRIDDSLIGRRSPAILAVVFAAVALLLAAIGTYGVLSYAVQQRWREIGLRMALGARPDQIRNQFLSIDASLLAAGIALGVIGALGASRAMRAILFGVPSLPAATLTVTALLMTVVSLTACLLPAYRATRADPMMAIRSD
ncbi:MAG TPA: ABC transporter permease [Gemmatimonadaceae bacterium]|nr:ABC transporter permease [Gemmatimonadaceae bacterium]